MWDVRYYSINAFLNFDNFYGDIYRFSSVCIVLESLG